MEAHAFIGLMDFGHENRKSDHGTRDERDRICRAILCRYQSARGVIHVFGAGYSSHRAVETFYPAGSLACTNGIRESLLSVNN
jgi:uncharacterized phosphosugar-binding protein